MSERQAHRGWYRDPFNPRRERYWTGVEWSTRTARRGRSRVAGVVLTLVTLAVGIPGAAFGGAAFARSQEEPLPTPEALAPSTTPPYVVASELDGLADAFVDFYATATSDTEPLPVVTVSDGRYQFTLGDGIDFAWDAPSLANDERVEFGGQSGANGTWCAWVTFEGQDWHVSADGTMSKGAC